MGWASGSGLCEEIVLEIDKRKDLTPEQKEEIYVILIHNFENYDCDTLMEVDNKRFKKVYQQIVGENDE